MARKSFFGRLADTLRGLVGIGPRPTPPEPEAVPPSPPPPPEPPPIIDITPYECDVRYIPTHQEFRASSGYTSKSGTAVSGRLYAQTVVGRWVVGDEVDPPSAQCFADLLQSSGKRGFVNLIIGGIYFQEYPGQEGNRTTYLSYIYQYRSINAALGDPSVATATDVMNELVAPFGEWWEEVFEVTIVDR